MTRTEGRRRRVRLPYVERLTQSLSARDWAIIWTLQRVRLASGAQLERLHFHDLAVRSRSVMRWRVLKRLTDARVIIPFERRIGTARAGSDQLCFTLDSAGQRLVRLSVNAASSDLRVRRPRPPGDRFVAHTLAVADLYVALVESSRINRFVLDDFQAEAGGYWPNGLGGWVKPDAFVKLHAGAVTDYWWYEADLATESLPTIRAKLTTYLDFVRRGQEGPDGVVPRILIGVPTTRRQVGIAGVVNSLPEPATAMFVVTLLSAVAMTMVHAVRNEV